jgi:hypothetical protein
VVGIKSSIARFSLANRVKSSVAIRRASSRCCVSAFPTVQTEAASQGLKAQQGPSPLELVVLSKKSHRIFGEYVLVSFPAPGYFDHMLRDFFACGIGVGRSGEPTTRLLNLVPSIIDACATILMISGSKMIAPRGNSRF